MKVKGVTAVPSPCCPGRVRIQVGPRRGFCISERESFKLQEDIRFARLTRPMRLIRKQMARASEAINFAGAVEIARLAVLERLRAGAVEIARLAVLERLRAASKGKRAR